MQLVGVDVLHEWTGGEDESPFHFVIRLYEAMAAAGDAAALDRIAPNSNGESLEQSP